MKDRGPIIRPLESGTTAALRDSDARHAAKQVDRLIAESPRDQPADVPVGTLIAWKGLIREQHVEELDEAGRLAPFGDAERSRFAVDLLAPIAEELDVTIAELVHMVQHGHLLPRKDRAA